MTRALGWLSMTKKNVNSREANLNERLGIDKTVKLRENLFHRLVNKHWHHSKEMLSQLVPLSHMVERSSEIFTKKIPDKVYQSVNWHEDPHVTIIDLTIGVTPDDIYKMNTYRSWAVERVAEALPLHRKYEEPEARVHGALLSIFSPEEKDYHLALKYHVTIFSLQEGLALNLDPTRYREVGAPFVLGHVSHLRKVLPLKVWLEEFYRAARLFKDEEDEFSFFVGFGKLILPTGEAANFIKEKIETFIKEESPVSESQVVLRILRGWDVPPEESKIIMKIIEGLNEEQRRIVLAALEGLNEEQRRIVLAALEETDEEKRRLMLKLLTAPPEKIELIKKVLEG